MTLKEAKRYLSDYTLSHHIDCRVVSGGGEIVIANNKRMAAISADHSLSQKEIMDELDYVLYGDETDRDDTFMDYGELHHKARKEAERRAKENRKRKKRERQKQEREKAEEEKGISLKKKKERELLEIDDEICEER